jgi:hypothetical protein
VNKTKRIPSRQLTTAVPVPTYKLVLAEVKRLGTTRAEWLRARIAEWALTVVQAQGKEKP